MSNWTFVFVLLYCCSVFGAPSNTTTDKQSENASTTDSAEEVSKPADMNIADYYYSIFGKHLDYDYREPLLTFDEPSQNDLSEDIESEVDKTSDALWDAHSRKKRFILVPSNYYNATRRWLQQTRRLREERRRLRNERRQAWRRNRINYLNTRSESLRNQATRLTLVQQRQQQEAAIAAARAQTLQAKSTDTVSSDAVINPTASESKQVPVRQVPVPTKP